MSHNSSDHDPHDHGHDHDHADHEDEQGPGDHALDAAAFTEAIAGARVGLKSRVAELVEVLPDALCYIPLSDDLPDAPLNETVPLEGELTFRPHMILNEDQSIFAVVYSEPEFADPMQQALGWQTSGEELKFICVPVSVAFELCNSVIDDEQVSGLVFNPGTDGELVLLRDEAASLAQGQAIPLVGYVADLPPDEDGATQLVEGADPPPAALVEALEAARDKIADLVGVEVATTFNPERDREPHLTITLTVIGRHGLDRQELADQVMEDAAEHVPAPGYADIVFIDAPN